MTEVNLLFWDFVNRLFFKEAQNCGSVSIYRPRRT